ncbi:hypothetical protein KIL84_013966, partial [Mauremys mutica]
SSPRREVERKAFAGCKPTPPPGSQAPAARLGAGGRSRGSGRGAACPGTAGLRAAPAVGEMSQRWCLWLLLAGQAEGGGGAPPFPSRHGVLSPPRSQRGGARCASRQPQPRCQHLLRPQPGLLRSAAPSSAAGPGTPRPRLRAAPCREAGSPSLACSGPAVTLRAWCPSGGAGGARPAQPRPAVRSSSGLSPRGGLARPPATHSLRGGTRRPKLSHGLGPAGRAAGRVQSCRAERQQRRRRLCRAPPGPRLAAGGGGGPSEPGRGAQGLGRGIRHCGRWPPPGDSGCPGPARDEQRSPGERKPGLAGPQSHWVLRSAKWLHREECSPWSSHIRGCTLD